MTQSCLNEAQFLLCALPVFVFDQHILEGWIEQPEDWECTDSSSPKTHGIIKVGKHLQDHQIQALLSLFFPQSEPPSSCSSQV